MMKLGFFLYGTGHHIASWRDPGVMPDANRSFKHYIEITQTAERGLFDFVFNADSNSTFGPDDPDIWRRTTVSMRLEPLTLLGALAAVTSHIGLISTATTTYLDPFHVARMFATLDQMSDGRVGWNVVTSSAASEALNFSHEAHAPHDHRYERAAEFIAGGAGPLGHLGGRRHRPGQEDGTVLRSRKAPSCCITRASISRCAGR